MPIGQPLPGMKLYVLDENLMPVPTGDCGELYVSGPNVARGYFKRPELTAEKFIPNPFEQGDGKTSHAYLYKTGDLGRCRSNGFFEMLGQVDRQIKINGIRLEMDEIEAILSQHPEVREAAILAQKTSLNMPYLVAYLVFEQPLLSVVDASKSYQVNGDTRAAHAQLIQLLKEYLETQLSYHVVPSTFVVLEQLPLTPNGKVDRKALLNQKHPLFRSTEFVAPRTEIETKLVTIWSEILNIERPGIYDDFFELGGNSLLATQIIARIRDIFFVELPFRTFFKLLTIAGLAARIQQIKLAEVKGMRSHPLNLRKLNPFLVRADE
jgi:acyl carrier protein